MKTEKVTKNEFDVVITLTKHEVLDLIQHLRRYSVRLTESVPVIDGLINNLRQYELPVKEEVNEKNEFDVLMKFTYRNKNGEQSFRRVKLSSVEHYGDGDLRIVAFDVDKDALRTFLFSRFVPNTGVKFEVGLQSVTIGSSLSGSKPLFLSYLMQAQNKADRLIYKL